MLLYVTDLTIPVNCANTDYTLSKHPVDTREKEKYFHLLQQATHFSR